MKNTELYSIGKVEKICDVTQRMLRYYEEQGLITPDYVDESSHYRYYSIETMQQIQIIRYMIDQGFNLEEIRQNALSGNLDLFEDMLLQQLQKVEKEINYYYQRAESLRQWGAVVLEGKQVLAHADDSVSVCFFPEQKFFSYEGEFDSEATLEIEYFTLSKQKGHTMVDTGGAFNYYYHSYEDRLSDGSSVILIMQPAYPKASSDEFVRSFGGFQAIRSYHIGSRDHVQETYRRMIDWARLHNYTLRGDSLERHVLDIYSTQDTNQFVTEVLLPVTEDTGEPEMHYHLTNPV